MKIPNLVIFGFFVLTVLKACGVKALAHWSWWEVTFPFWFIPTVILSVFILIGLFYILLWTGKAIADRFDND